MHNSLLRFDFCKSYKDYGGMLVGAHNIFLEEITNRHYLWGDGLGVSYEEGDFKFPFIHMRTLRIVLLHSCAIFNLIKMHCFLIEC